MRDNSENLVSLFSHDAKANTPREYGEKAIAELMRQLENAKSESRRIKLRHRIAAVKNTFGLTG
jgi:hypothetical protein